MAVTIAAPLSSRRHEAHETRLISSNLLFSAPSIGSSDMTARRPAGVGRPTISTVVVPLEDAGDHGDCDDPQADNRPLPTSALVREAIDTALDSLVALEHQARDTARRFRRLALDDGQQRLVELVESTRTLLDLAAMTAQATGTDIETVCGRHDLAVERQTQSALSAMIGRQLERDWHGLARVIEQAFVAALAGWRAVFEALSDPTDPCGHAA